jgi:hypothetical protein
MTTELPDGDGNDQSGRRKREQRGLSIGRWMNCLNDWRLKNPEHIALKYYRAYHSGSAKREINSDHLGVQTGEVQPDFACRYHADGRDGLVEHRRKENSRVCGHPGQRQQLQLYCRYALHPAFPAALLSGGHLYTAAGCRFMFTL